MQDAGAKDGEWYAIGATFRDIASQAESYSFKSKSKNSIFINGKSPRLVLNNSDIVRVVRNGKEFISSPSTPLSTYIDFSFNECFSSIENQQIMLYKNGERFHRIWCSNLDWPLFMTYSIGDTIGIYLEGDTCCDTGGLTIYYKDGTSSSINKNCSKVSEIEITGEIDHINLKYNYSPDCN